MPNVATGHIESLGNSFTSRFNVNGRSKTFSGSLSQGVMPFQSTRAIITYSNPGDPSGPYEITFSNEGIPSFVGEDSFVFNLKNKDGITMKISGTLVAPIDERQTVTGEGKWADN